MNQSPFLYAAGVLYSSFIFTPGSRSTLPRAVNHATISTAAARCGCSLITLPRLRTLTGKAYLSHSLCLSCSYRFEAQPRVTPKPDAASLTPPLLLALAMS